MWTEQNLVIGLMINTVAVYMLSGALLKIQRLFTQQKQK